MRLRDAARVACVSHSFRRSWRCYPNLTITRKTLGLKGGKYGRSYKISSALARKTDRILRKHSGIGVKALKLQINDFPMFSTFCDLDRWLHIAVKPGIEELDLWLGMHSHDAAVYDFPSSLLLDGNGKSIRHLHLSNCVLRPTAGLGCLRSLTSLDFCDIRITGDELGYLFSSSVALETLTLMYCHELFLLEIPSLLQRLSHLIINGCKNLEVIESKAPNLYSFRYMGHQVRLSLGDSLRDFKIHTSGWDFVHYASENLLPMLANLEALDIYSRYVRKAPLIPDKFLHLQLLCVGFFSPDYDYFSLISLLDACPSLETFVLSVEPDRVEQESVLGDSYHDLRKIPGHLHGNIKDVQIIGFCSARSIVELTCHILENAKSLECLTLSTFYNGQILCSTRKKGKCLSMSRLMIMEARKALLVVEKYIVGKVPPSVELKVVEPCSRCNPLEI
ncbi:uncharacterized protein LOC124658011 [Lolium rigidum]|uniref:uncharacterized protein LOC124658011 n=1 Tax=Lolium rigidum TaxID=89674 RepID=UPI001F5C427E|nr:uncharacterized protein LOC124658011 [Lolium rigidum]